ncbi:Ti-type conjugative transfer relaxase TraA [Phyllobacterium phragmitis]|uniref:Ti-type conjugative transfer relaxase TraA n=1 Tax=Phyllobacterium phragmitis TaxID=2670329 RepID=A0A2S9ISQ5_9HYPH|nr:Ti-type conjugative transfer relaxase TraA [Phyllobacterium phragmitis]PRD43556.1 Ti-type conjugative transfer relaxase TraA [Phyllobacterium phragmitis]
MAITHFTPQIIGRADGRSAVLSAAYRHCAKMEHEAEARVVDYTHKRGLGHEEFLLPADAPEWARALIADRSVAGAVEAFWNSVEAFEKRADAQFAKEFIIALPVELTKAQNVALMRQFVFEQVLARGQVADWVIHDEPGNPHAHLMTTLRPLTEKGFGGKKVAVIGSDGEPVRTKSGKIQYRLWAGEKAEFLQQRRAWLDLQNQHLALAGLDLRVDGRSYAERGIDIVPTTHIGVAAMAILRKARIVGRKPELEQLQQHEARREINASRIVARPELVLDIVSQEKSVFDERDIAKVLHRYIDDAVTFQQLMLRVPQSPQCLRLDVETVDLSTGARVPAKLTTREMVRLESEMVNRARFLARAKSHGVRRQVLRGISESHSRLSDEQRVAIGHVASSTRIAAVVGRAGAGKTTMMKAAREAWETAGYRVVGGALAGKAAEGLEKEAGITSRTLASWELAWQRGRDQIDDKTVFVLDEAGMVASRQMAEIVETVTKAGAKLVLVGDPDQLQPIEAGAAFRAIADRIGYAELGTIYRQRNSWMRTASMDLARGDVSSAIGAYDKAGLVQTGWTRDEAIEKLIADWNHDYDPDKSSLILAYLRRDVRTLNELARARLVERGLVQEGFVFRTEDGERMFSAGDRIVLLRNEGSLGVKNGMLAKVVEAGPGRLVAEIGEGGATRRIEIDQRSYRNVDHGYATTIHKSQGATVDDVRVLASRHMDRHLTYVALTRHRDDARFYVGVNEFTKRGGVVVEHGVAPFENNPKNRDSYFVTLDMGEGKRSTIWGVDLERAIKAADVQIGDRIGLEHKGSEKLKLPDGKQVERHSWEVVDIRAIAVSRLTERLSRDGAKETTLDYTGGRLSRQVLSFAETRGLHLMRVARTLIRDRLEWTLRQKERLAALGQQLRAVGARLGLVEKSVLQNPRTAGKVEPMVKGVTTFALSINERAEQKLRSDPALSNQWNEFSDRIRLIYADPEAAFRAMRFEMVLADRAEAKERMDQLERDPMSFGPLRGRDGFLAGKADREDRQVAEVNVPALRRDVERYLAMREMKLNTLTAGVRAERQRLSIDIPALSPSAAIVLEKVRDAIDRNDLPAALGFALADRMAKAEIDAFNKKVAERFGERTFLSRSAKEAAGHAFENAAAGMTSDAKQKLVSAWPVMRAGQQLAAHERTTQVLKETEALRQSQRQASVLKP